MRFVAIFLNIVGKFIPIVRYLEKLKPRQGQGNWENKRKTKYLVQIKHLFSFQNFLEKLLLNYFLVYSGLSIYFLPKKLTFF